MDIIEDTSSGILELSELCPGSSISETPPEATSTRCSSKMISKQLSNLSSKMTKQEHESGDISATLRQMQQTLVEQQKLIKQLMEEKNSRRARSGRSRRPVPTRPAVSLFCVLEVGAPDNLY